MENKDSDLCMKHLSRYFKCTSEGCTNMSVCKICCLESKESIGHLYEHFDLIVKQEDEISKFKDQMKISEEFGELNKVFIEQLDKATNITDNIFRNLENSRSLINSKLRSSFYEKYESIIKGFEEFVIKFSQKMEKLNTSDKNIKKEIGEMKKELDEKLNFLGDQSLMSKDFEQLSELMEKKLLNSKIETLFNGDLKLSSMKKGNCKFLDRDNNSITTIAKKSGSYWSVLSEEILDQAFEAKIKIVNIDESKTKDYWNYGVGIQRLNSTKNDSYYEDSVILLSNGYIAQQFTGSGSHKQLFFENWKKDDIIMIKRDILNNVYFGKNDSESYKLAFDSIGGSFRLILGFSNFCSGDIFEIVEIDKNPLI